MISSTKARNRTNKSIALEKQSASSALKSWYIGAMISSLPRLDKVVMSIFGSTLGRPATYPTPRHWSMQCLSLTTRSM